MTRTFTAAAKTESLKASGAKPIALIKLTFDSGATRVWSGRGDITWGGETYAGVGDLGKISAVEEGVDDKALGIALELTGIPGAMISLALGEDVQGRSCHVWVSFLDASYALVADPVLVFQGRMDTMDVKLGETATVSVTAQSKLIDWDRPAGLLYTDAAQRGLFAGDKGLEFVTDAAGDREIVWGPVPG